MASLNVICRGCNGIRSRLNHIAPGVFILVLMMSGCQNLDTTTIPPKPQVYPNLDSGLSKLVSTYEVAGIAAALDAAKGQGIQIADSMVRVIIEARPGGKAAVVDAVGVADGRVETSYEDLVQALVPIGQLKVLAANVVVNLIRLPVISFPGGNSGPQ
jgi:hypothetical protein